jgi:hypothetical protein
MSRHKIIAQTAISMDHAYILKLVLQKASHLKDLRLGFDCSSSSLSFFQRLGNYVERNNLRCLTLVQLKTEKKDLQKFLQASKNTLESLSLEWVSFSDQSPSLEDVLVPGLNLRTIKLCCLNFGRKCLVFSRINLQRPWCITIEGEEDWLMVATGGWHDRLQAELVLEVDNGDDLRYWLGCIGVEDLLEEVWSWNNDRYLLEDQLPTCFKEPRRRG